MYMLRRFIYILIIAITTALTAAVVYAVSNNEDTNIEIVNITPTPTIAPTSSSKIEEYEVEINLSNEEITPEPTIEIKPTSTLLITPEITNAPTQQVTPTTTPNPTNTPKPTNTPQPTAEPTATPAPTASPTPAPDYTLNQDSHFISEVLRGVNNERDFEGVPHVYLDDELTELAEQHAIAMALKDESSFHSDYFYVESVRSGCYINGFMEGVGAAGHATQLAMDEEVTRIGVGSATSKTGKVFTCLLGGSDGW